MNMTLNPLFLTLSIICFALILALDVLPRFISGHLSVLLSLFGVGLHLPLMPLMLFAGFTLEWLVLAYAASLLAFTLSHYIRYTLGTRRAVDKEDGV